LLAYLPVVKNGVEIDVNLVQAGNYLAEDTSGCKVVRPRAEH